MPSSLSGGPVKTYLRIARSLRVLATGVFVLEPKATPASGVKGELYVGTDGKLYIHNGTAFVVVGTQT